MTLFDLLMFTAAGMPLGWVVLAEPQLDAVGLVVGLCLAVVAGVAQLVGHHKLMAVFDRILNNNEGVWTVSLVTMYYVAIPLLGVFCGELTLNVARSVS